MVHVARFGKAERASPSRGAVGRTDRVSDRVSFFDFMVFESLEYEMDAPRTVSLTPENASNTRLTCLSRPPRPRVVRARASRFLVVMGARRARGGAKASTGTSTANVPSHWTREIARGLRDVASTGEDASGSAEGGGGANARRAACADAARALFMRLARALREVTDGGADGADRRARRVDSVDELVVDGLDAEQVWTQVNAGLAPALTECKRAVKALGGKYGDGGSTDVGELFQVSVEDDSGKSDEEEEEDDDALDESEDEDVSDDDEDEGVRAKSGKKTSGSDRTEKFFKDPGMFSLEDMEIFMDQGDEEEEERRRMNERDGDDDSEDDEGDIYGEMSDGDDDLDDDEDSEEGDDLDDALAYTAKLAGVSATTSRKKKAKAKGKKAQDLMFEDFFGKHKGKPIGGTKGGKLGASNDAELAELSDEEEDMFNALEGEEDADEEEDDVDGELETGISGNRGLENHDQDDDEYDEHEDEEDAEPWGADHGDEELDALDKKLDAELDAEIARAEDDAEDVDEDEDDGDAANRPKSAFQRQQEALARQMDKLEAAAIGEKSWLLKGEAGAKERPMNSALETDLEFEHVMAPAPVISAEITQKLEDIIKQRIIEGRFDDVERVEPVEERERKELPQLDDAKSTKGLGDIYADEYMKQKVGVALGEKEDPTVAEVKKLWAMLSYRLDALSRTGVVEEVKDIEARVEDELAVRARGNYIPNSVKDEDRLAPEEVFVGGGGKGGQRGSAAGNVKADDELTKEERKAARAKRKRKSKAVREEKDRVKSKRDREREAQHKAEEEAGFVRKAPKVAMLAVGSAAGKSKSDFSKSSKVFGMLQDAKEADAARGGPAKKSKSDSTTNKSSLKL